MADTAGMLDLDPEILAHLKATGMDPGMLSDFDRRAFRYATQSKRGQAQEDAYRAQQSTEGTQAWRRLVDLMRGGQPSREMSYEPPARPAMMNPFAPYINGAPINNPNPSRFPGDRSGVRG